MEYSVILLTVAAATLQMVACDTKYYMDSQTDCSRGIINLNNGREVTVKGRSSFLLSSVSTGTCTMTFRSRNGFTINFDEGEIEDCGVTLSLHSGSSGNSPIYRSYTCNSWFKKADERIYGEYLTVKLTRLNYSKDYKFELEIEGRGGSGSSGGYFYGIYGDLSTGIIVAIVVSAVISLLCCILVPVGIYCCLKKRRRSQREVPVVYAASPHQQAGYGRPVYIQE